MKKIILIAIAWSMAFLSYAQDNPYKIFGYKPKVVYKDNPADIYKITNSDFKCNIKYLIFNRETKTIKLLDDRDSVIQTIKYTDQDIIRWMAVDPYARKYPSMSPYNYGGNNPIRNIDVHGDSIRTTGSASATAAYKQTAEAGMGNIATLNQAKNGNWTLSSLTDDQKLSMTSAQADAYSGLSAMISNSKTASFNLVDSNDPVSQQITVGDNGTAGKLSATPGVHTIDMGDVKAFGSSGMLTSAGALAHELKEGFEIQTQNLTSRAQILGAHKDGIRFENAVNGTNPGGRYDDSRPSPTGTMRIPIVTTVNGVVTPAMVTVTLHNGNFTGADINNNPPAN